MTFLIITDNENKAESLIQLINKSDNKLKVIISDFTEKQLKKQAKYFDQLAACVICSYDSTDFSEEILNILTSITGYLLAGNIPVYTNLKKLKITDFLSKSSINIAESSDKIFTKIETNLQDILSNDKCRTSKKALFNKGIPFTPDCMAMYIEKNKSEIFNLFISAGMDVNSRDETGTPMLNVAVRNDNENFAKKLIALGADINAVSEDRGYTAVMDAVWRGNVELTKLLVSKNADLNTISKEGQNNLVLAVGADRDKIVKILVENGADPDVKDMMGMSAYGYATLFRKEKIIEILKPYHKE